jgi:short subunit dehydrogenase-like uncharacterized protein
MDWMIYGANGYTGELIAREAKSRGGIPVLAGRSVSKVTALAKELRLSPKVFALATRQPESWRRCAASASY